MKTQTLKTIKPGEFFKRKPEALTVFVKGPFDRASKTFECHAFDDINRVINLKAVTPVTVGFTF